MSDIEELRGKLRDRERTNDRWAHYLLTSTRRTQTLCYVYAPMGLFGIVIIFVLRDALPLPLTIAFMSAFGLCVLGLVRLLYNVRKLRHATRALYRQEAADIAYYDTQLDIAEGKDWDLR